MEYAVSNNNKRFRSADARWLALAVALHALLLLIPLREKPPAPTGAPPQLLLRLVTTPAEQREQPETEPASPPDVTEPQAVDQPTEPIPGTDMPRVAADETEVAEPQEPPDETPQVTAARLISLRDTLTEAVPLDPDAADTTRRLGTPTAFELPHNWQRGAGAQALAPFDNTFNGKTVPAQVEVVDRWLAADGSHQVVVETPAGLRMCGRTQRSDPMQPLVEHIMMWTVCGGDGKVPFRFKPREPLDRDFIVPVAKDATEP